MLQALKYQVKKTPFMTFHKTRKLLEA